MSGPRLNIDGYIFSDFVDLQLTEKIDLKNNFDFIKENRQAKRTCFMKRVKTNMNDWD